MSQHFKPDGVYKIFCNKKWARNSPGEPWIVLDNAKAALPSFEHWEIKDVPNGFTIQNVATGLYAHFEASDQTLRLSNEATRWYIQPAGGHDFRISLPDTDSIWTSVRAHHEVRFALEGAHGTHNQQIQLVKVDKDVLRALRM